MQICQEIRVIQESERRRQDEFRATMVEIKHTQHIISQATTAMRQTLSSSDLGHANGKCGSGHELRPRLEPEPGPPRLAHIPPQFDDSRRAYAAGLQSTDGHWLPNNKEGYSPHGMQQDMPTMQAQQGVPLAHVIGGLSQNVGSDVQPISAAQV